MNLLPLIVNLPVFIQLLVSSSACVYIGTSVASRVVKLASGEVKKAQKHSE
jgi:hypothetical protein